MIKKMLMVGLVLTMMFGITACSTDDSDTTNIVDSGTSEKKDRPFTESDGLIKYFTIEDEKIPLPETVGEYVRYLEKLGNKVELGDTGKTVYDAPKLAAGGISSMVAYLKVFNDDFEDEWQWFGIRYENDTDETIAISDCKVTQITLDYDTIMEEENHHEIDSIEFVTSTEKIPMDGNFTSAKMFKIIGMPGQNTDGHMHYQDDQGYKYEFVTENKKGILTRLVITYPTK